MEVILIENISSPHQFDTIAIEIERRYEGIVSVVRERKRALLIRLSEFREEYESLLSNRLKTERELKSAKEHVEEIQQNDLRTLRRVMSATIEERKQKLLSAVNYFVQFECESGELENKLSRLGELGKMDYEQADYSEMVTPVAMRNQENELNQSRENGLELVEFLNMINQTTEVTQYSESSLELKQHQLNDELCQVENKLKNIRKTDPDLTGVESKALLVKKFNIIAELDEIVHIIDQENREESELNNNISSAAHGNVSDTNLVDSVPAPKRSNRKKISKINRKHN